MNVYLLLGTDGFRMIDCGYDSEPSRIAFARNLRELGLRPADLRQILLTHADPDHVGLAVDLVRQSGAAILVHQKENPPGDRAAQRIDRRWLEQHGVDPEIALRLMHARRLPPGAVMFRRSGVVHFGGFTLRLICCAGHSAGLTCVLDVDRGLLYSSDQLLRGMTPLMRVAGGSADPLTSYLRGLAALRRQPVTRVLPGHGRSFGDVHAELDRAVTGQMEQLNRVAAALDDTPRTALEVARAVDGQGPMPAHLRVEQFEAIIAMRALAYLYHLVAASQARADRGRIVRFRRS